MKRKLVYIKRMEQHDKIIKKNEEKSSSEMVQHHHDKHDQCRFNPSYGFIIDNEIDYKKRKIKESIYSIINNSINRHKQLMKAGIRYCNNKKTKYKKELHIKRNTFD